MTDVAPFRQMFPIQPVGRLKNFHGQIRAGATAAQNVRKLKKTMQCRDGKKMAAPRYGIRIFIASTPLKYQSAKKLQKFRPKRRGSKSCLQSRKSSSKTKIVSSSHGDIFPKSAAQHPPKKERHQNHKGENDQ